MNSSEKNLRQDSVRSNTAAQRGNGDPSKAELVVIDREERRHKLWLNTIQRTICIGLAAWILLNTGNTQQFIIILAAGFIDFQWAKKILTGVMNVGIGAIGGAIDTIKDQNR